MHAAFTAPSDTDCPCEIAPCGGVTVDERCAWHRDTANYWHAAEECDNIQAARAIRAEAAKNELAQIRSELDADPLSAFVVTVSKRIGPADIASEVRCTNCRVTYHLNPDITGPHTLAGLVQAAHRHECRD